MSIKKDFLFDDQNYSNDYISMKEMILGSIHSGASKIELIINSIGFSLHDNGEPISRSEIEKWFKTDGKNNLKSRLAKGHIFGLARTNWHTGSLELSTNLVSEGLLFINIKEKEVSVDENTIFGEWSKKETSEDKDFMDRMCDQIAGEMKYALNVVITINGKEVNKIDRKLITHENEKLIFIYGTDGPLTTHSDPTLIIYDKLGELISFLPSHTYGKVICKESLSNDEIKIMIENIESNKSN